jgi:hypothetical protein
MKILHIARECPRFSTCSVNNCPLDPHPANPGDKQTVCKMEKAVRQRIAAKYPGQLASGGLTAREAAGKRIFENLPLAVKSRLAATGKSNLAKINSGKVGENAG